MKRIRVMMVGSAEKSKGGVTSVLHILKQCKVWKDYDCYWLGIQIQGNYFLKLLYCIRAYIVAFFSIWKYDIIHFHTVPDISLVVQFPVFLMAMLWRKKIILHLHMGNQIEQEIHNRLFLFCMKHSDLILVLAKLWKDKYRIWFPDNKTPVSFLYNAFQPVDSIDYSLRTKTIIYAAHLNENKAYDVLLKGFKEIVNQYPDWTLIVMGDGEVDKARNLAKELGISSQVEFTGYIVGEQKKRYFQQASIFCLSSYQEGFPMVVLEAWGYGIPIITTPVGGLPDVLEEGKNACVFGFGDYASMGLAMQKLISNVDLRHEMSCYSQNFVAQRFSMKAVNDKLCKLYQKLIML